VTLSRDITVKGRSRKFGNIKKADAYFMSA